MFKKKISIGVAPKHFPPCTTCHLYVSKARNSGLPMAGQILGRQVKIMMNCQMDNKLAGEIYWTGFVTFSSSLTMLLYLIFPRINSPQ